MSVFLFLLRGVGNLVEDFRGRHFIFIKRNLCGNRLKDVRYLGNVKMYSIY